MVVIHSSGYVVPCLASYMSKHTSPWKSETIPASRTSHPDPGPVGGLRIWLVSPCRAVFSGTQPARSNTSGSGP